MRLKSPNSRRRQCAIEPLESRTMLSLAGQVVGYVPDYEYNAISSKIDYSAVTRLNYFSLVANGNGSLNTTSVDGYPFSPPVPPSPPQPNDELDPLVAAAHAASPRVAVSITIDPASAFQAIADSSTATNAFITNILAFTSAHNLDGIDLDYEPGTLTGTQITSWGNFLATLHAQTSAHGLILSAAVQAAQMIVPKADIPDLDSFYLMDYDLDFNSSAPFSDWKMWLTNWTNYGVPKSKLIVGVPFYGRAGTGWNNSQTSTYSSILSGYASLHGGALPAPTVDSITIGSNTWGFDSISDMQQDANYILQNSYGGMMIWELGQDQFTSTGYGQDALLPAIKSAFTLPLTASTGASYTLTTTALTITSGTLTATGDLSTIDPNLSITVNSGASLILNATEHLAALTLNGGTASATSSGGVVVVGSLSITNGGSLDLQNTGMIIHNGNLAAVTTLIGQGFAGGLWNGLGITSSTAALSSDATLGIELNDDGTPSHHTLLSTFDGQTVINTDVLVKYTFFGDADLSGAVNATDYSLIDSGFNNNNLTGWRNGDFNYDGVINGDDYTLIDNAFNTQAAAPLAQPANLLAATPAPLPSPFKAKAAVAFPPAAAVSSSTSDENPFASGQTVTIDDILNDAVRS
jgi:Glycosyl hydrolases family 18